MADKSKPKTASRAKAKAAKPADAKPVKAAESASTPPKTPAGKKAGKATKVGERQTGRGQSRQVCRQCGSRQEGEARRTPAGETYYVYTEVLPIEIRDTPPSGETQFVEFSSFDDARDHLLEHLIELIEHHERVLHAVRRADSLPTISTSTG